MNLEYGNLGYVSPEVEWIVARTGGRERAREPRKGFVRAASSVSLSVLLLAAAAMGFAALSSLLAGAETAAYVGAESSPGDVVPSGGKRCPSCINGVAEAIAPLSGGLIGLPRVPPELPWPSPVNGDSGLGSADGFGIEGKDLGGSGDVVPSGHNGGPCFGC